MVGKRDHRSTATRARRPTPALSCCGDVRSAVDPRPDHAGENCRAAQGRHPGAAVLARARLWRGGWGVQTRDGSLGFRAAAFEEPRLTVGPDNKLIRGTLPPGGRWRGLLPSPWLADSDPLGRTVELTAPAAPQRRRGCSRRSDSGRANQASGMTNVTSAAASAAVRRLLEERRRSGRSSRRCRRSSRMRIRDDPRHRPGRRR